MATNGLTRAEEKMLRDDLEQVNRALGRPACLGSTANIYRSLQTRLRARLELESPQDLHEAAKEPLGVAKATFYWMRKDYDKEFENAA